MMREMKYNVDVTIHLGMHKTGTTYLQQNFFESYKNESGYFALRKHAHEFLRYTLFCGESRWNLDRARELLDMSLSNSGFNRDRMTIVEEMLCGDPYMNAFNRRLVFQRLNMIFPKAKYILVLREQESMVQTLYLQYIKLGGSCSWNEFLTNQGPPLMFSWGEYLNYTSYVEEIHEAVGSERFLCTLYERMLDDPTTFLIRMSDFIGFKYSPSTLLSAPRGTNPSLSPRTAAILRRTNKLCCSYRQPFLLMSESAQKRIRRFLVRLSSKRKDAIPSNVVRDFCKELKSRNDELTKVVGVDVSTYGY